MDSERIAFGILMIITGGVVFYFNFKSTLKEFPNLEEFNDGPLLNRTKLFILSLFTLGFVMIIVELTL
jgi:hypothetical protein